MAVAVQAVLGEEGGHGLTVAPEHRGADVDEVAEGPGGEQLARRVVDLADRGAQA